MDFRGRYDRFCESNLWDVLGSTMVQEAQSRREPAARLNPELMGPPGGTGDRKAAVHDYNFSTNGITIGSYFNPHYRLLHRGSSSKAICN
jgi:hypothetical protein